MKVGDVINIDYPFYRSKIDIYEKVLSDDLNSNEVEIKEIDTWNAGVYSESHWMSDDAYHTYHANAMGVMRFKIIEITKLPRPYHTRIFYKRTFIDPDGKEFGKNLIQIKTLQTFNKLCRGWFGEEFEVTDTVKQQDNILDGLV